MIKPNLFLWMLPVLSCALLGVMLALLLPLRPGAQERSVIGSGIAAQAAETRLRNRIDMLNARLEALNQESRRRMSCQHDTQVSTPSGCQKIPGLESFILNNR